MKKLSLLALSVGALALLPNCKKSCKKEVIVEEQTCSKKEHKRVSGPLSEKEVGWEKNDFE